MVEDYAIMPMDQMGRIGPGIQGSMSTQSLGMMGFGAGGGMGPGMGGGMAPGMIQNYPY